MSSVFRRTAMLVGVIAIATLALTTCALAGDYHKGAGLTCSDCHIMHASKNGTVYPTGTNTTNPAGVSKLLKFDSTNELCLSCHAGTDTTAPDIVAGGTAAAPTDALGIAYNSVYKNSGGYFQSDHASAASGVGHDLGGGVEVTAIQGTWKSGALSTGMNCAQCHDPHGTANYRNLLLKPGTAGADVNVQSGTQVYLREAITDPATALATPIHYDTSAVGFSVTNNITNWCVGCHTNITTGNKHKMDQPVSALTPGTHWTDGTTGTPGFGSDVGDGTSGIPRVRFGGAAGTYASSTTVANTNTVFCLSCHKAHGSKYDSATLWPHYTDAAADQTSACDQCHKKGA